MSNQNIFCTACGQANDAQANFCINCSAQLIKPEQQATAAPVAPIEQAPVTQTVVPPVAPAPAKPQFDFKKIIEFFKAIPKWVKIGACALVVLIIGVIVFFSVGSSVNNPQNVAEGYFKAMVTGDFEAAYGYYAMKDSELVNAKAYAAYMQAQEDDMPEIVSYTIIDAAQAKNAIADELKDSLGDLADLIDEYSDDIDITMPSDLKTLTEPEVTKEYLVTYYTKDSTTPNTQVITLVKNNKKAWLFFDSYDVKAEDFVAENFTLQVEKGSTDVTIDGFALKDPISEDDESYDIYKIDKIFTGEHEVVAKHKFFEDVTEDIYVYGSDETKTIYNEELKTAINDEIIASAQADFDTVMAGAAAGTKFSALGLNITDKKPDLAYSSDYDVMIENDYDDLTEMWNPAAVDTFDRTDLVVSDSDFDMYNFDSTNLTCEIMADLTYNYSTVTTDDKNKQVKTPKADETTTVYLTYGYSDAKGWALQDIAGFYEIGEEYSW
ncbi:MAG: zinc ribbon domain-containing protein [Oscillospiraceae bacterium]|jgi:hypothetical protein|nr:zinc ribbon domain-containing protein [Oscillospiraceae bacterium]